MSLSWLERFQQFKSPLKIIAPFLLRRRTNKHRQVKWLQIQHQHLKIQRQHLQHTVDQHQQRLQQQTQIAHLTHANEQHQHQPSAVPLEPLWPQEDRFVCLPRSSHWIASGSQCAYLGSHYNCDAMSQAYERAATKAGHLWLCSPMARVRCNTGRVCARRCRPMAPPHRC